VVQDFPDQDGSEANCQKAEKGGSNGNAKDLRLVFPLQNGDGLSRQLNRRHMLRKVEEDIH
jgi:hypothetical protein